MPPSEMKERWERLKSPQPTDNDYSKAEGRLADICGKIQALLSGPDMAKKLVVLLEPGLKTNMGQQLNVVIEVPQRDYRDTLFRVYVPLQGKPVQLDFYGEEVVAAQDLDDVETRILSFLEKDEVKVRMHLYKEMATK